MKENVVILRDDLPDVRQVAQKLFGKAPIKILLWSELRRTMSFKSLVRFLWGLECSTLAIGVADFDFMTSPVLCKLLLIVGRAQRRFLFDGSCRCKSVSTSQFILVSLPMLVGEFISGALIVLLHYIAVSVLFLVPFRRREMPLPSEQTKKVAYLRAHFYRVILGGTLAHTRGVIEGFEKNGYRVSFLSTDRISGMEAHEKFHLIRPLALFKNFGEIRELAYNLGMIWNAFGILRRENPDFLYHRHTGFCLGPLVLAKILRKPLILEFNSSDYARAKLWKDRRYYFPGLLQRIERLNLARADLVVAVSEVLKNQIIEAVPEAGGRVILNPNGVNPDKFAPDVLGHEIRAKLKIDPDKVVVGHAGTFMPYHGVDVLAKSIVELSRQIGPDRVCFLFLGAGKLEEDVKKLLSDNGCASSARFAGAIPFDDIQDYLGACDVLVAPNYIPSPGVGFYWSPIKIFEYMAMGKAIIASRIGQISDVLVDGEDSLLVPPGDVGALTAAMLRAVKDPELCSRIGDNARRKVVVHYTWRQNVLNVLNGLEGMKTSG